MISLTNSSSTIEHRPLPTNDPKQRQPDISKAEELLDWEPLTPRDKGLQETLDYFLEPDNNAPKAAKT